MRLIAFLEILILWLLWWYPFVFRAPKAQKRDSVTAPGATRFGLLVESLGIFLVFLFRTFPYPRTGALWLVLSLAVGITGVVLMWSSIAHLGRQFRITAGLYHDHELITSGPYSIVRHPLYAGLLAMTLSTGLLLTDWPWLAVGIAVHLAGTEIRVRAEDRLLESRFGSKFYAYQKRTPAYVPFVR
jgi:protein-S-isoprenylcysteine O-methyltransferase Ste14